MIQDNKKRIFFIICCTYILCILLLPAIHYLRYISGDHNYPPLVREVRYPVLLLFSVFFAAYWFYIKFRAQYFPGTKWPLYIALLIFLGLYTCSTYPVFSIDLYEFISRGRIWSVYNANPYFHAPSEFPKDMFYNIIFWKTQPTIYGPLWAWLTWLPTKLAGDSIFFNQFAMKLVLFIFYILSGMQIYKLARSFGYAKPIVWTELFLLNPFIIISVLMDGHNDIVMVFFILASLVQLKEGRDLAGVLFLILSALAKYITIIFLPLYALYFYFKYKGVRQKADFAIKAGLVSALAVIVIFSPFWQGMKTLGPLIAARASFHDNTVTYGIYSLFAAVFPSLSMSTFMALSQYVFMAFYAIMLLLFLRSRRRPQDLISFIVIIFIGYFCLDSFQFGCWYIVWLVPFIILSEFPLAGFMQLLVSFAALISFWKRISYLLIAAACVYGIVYFMREKTGYLFEIKGLKEKD